jgi:hypothetical protein
MGTELPFNPGLTGEGGELMDHLSSARGWRPGIKKVAMKVNKYCAAQLMSSIETYSRVYIFVTMVL